MAKSVSFSQTAVTVTPATTDNIVEGNNLFYTTSRANSAIDARVQTSINTALSSLSTSDIDEGTNLYHTPLRVRQSLQAGTGITINSQTGEIDIDTSSLVSSVSGVGGSVSNAQIAAGISRTTISNLNLSGNITAAYYNGDGSALTGLVSNSYIQSVFPTNSYVNAQLSSYASNSYLTSALSNYAGNTYVQNNFAGNTYVQNNFAGNSYVQSTYATATAPSFSGTASFTGNIFTKGLYIEKANVISAGLGSSYNYNLQDGPVHYHTSSATANATVNIQGLTNVNVGNVISLAILNTNGATAYRIDTVQIDGTTANVSTKWLNGAVPNGNGSNVDIYNLSIVKTDVLTYTVFASQSNFN